MAQFTSCQLLLAVTLSIVYLSTINCQPGLYSSIRHARHTHTFTLKKNKCTGKTTGVKSFVGVVRMAVSYHWAKVRAFNPPAGVSAGAIPGSKRRW